MTPVTVNVVQRDGRYIRREGASKVQGGEFANGSLYFCGLATIVCFLRLSTPVLLH